MFDFYPILEVWYGLNGAQVDFILFLQGNLILFPFSSCDLFCFGVFRWLVQKELGIPMFTNKRVSLIWLWYHFTQLPRMLFLPMRCISLDCL